LANTKRILVLTADAGFGHRSAANAVAAAIQERYDERCQVVIVNPLENRRVPAILRNSPADYDRMVRNVPELYRLGYEATDTMVSTLALESAIVLMLFEVLSDALTEQRPDVIVTTYPLYQAPLWAIYTLGRQRVPLVTVVTDLATIHRIWFHKVADLCLVPTPQAEKLALSHGLTRDQVRVTGIPIHPSFATERHDPSIIRSELGLNPDLTTLLAVGSKRVGHLEAVLHVINHSGLPLQMVVVAGGDDALYRRLRRVEWHTPCQVHNLVSNMPTLMHAADCILCKAGGLIVSESLAAGLPMLLADVLPGQEIGNAEYVIKGDAGVRIDDPLDALEALCHWLESDAELLREKAANARRLGRPHAAAEIADYTWALASRSAVDSPTVARKGRQGLKRLLSSLTTQREHGGGSRWGE
jgi:1,2-diacylglycerol 3-beta-galactosyltransferase